MDFIKSFEQLSISDLSIAGGKATSLGKLIQHSFPVPEGFVITTSAFTHFLSIHKLNDKRTKLKEKLAASQWEMAEKIAQDLYEQILSSPITGDLRTIIYNYYAQLYADFVAIRSSAIEEDQSHASGAGIMSTFLNTQKQDLWANIKHCWASLFSRRAINYWRIRSNTSPDLRIAVIVQKMIESEISGVAFSINPVSHNSSQIVIEAALGLGEGIVSGSITPDNYRLDKSTLQILEKHVSSQPITVKKVNDDSIQSIDTDESSSVNPKLRDEQIIDLAQYITGIELIYNTPVDVEWACKNEQFYFLQSRPISTLKTTQLNDYSLTNFDTLSGKISEYEFWWSDHESQWAIDCRLYILYTYKKIIWNQIDDVLIYTIKGKSSAYISQTDVQKAKKRGEVHLQSDYLRTLETVQNKCILGHQQLYQQLKIFPFPEISKLLSI